MDSLVSRWLTLNFKNDPAFLRLHLRCRHLRHHFVDRRGDRNLGKAARRQGIEETGKRTAKRESLTLKTRVGVRPALRAGGWVVAFVAAIICAAKAI